MSKGMGPSRLLNVQNERGQGMAEYIIIVILVAIIVLVAIRVFGESVFNQFEEATTEVDDLQVNAPAPG